MADPIQGVHAHPVARQEDPEQKSPEQVVYVGPRPFERDKQSLFFGRDREISELLSLVISSRVVLCYAPSGAGKTSLINAGLQPRLEQEGFEVLPSARVGGQIPTEIEQKKIPNLYTFNALLSLTGKGGIASELVGHSLAEFLAACPHTANDEGFLAPRILIFDQFEELLTSYPEFWQQREAFFHQVHAALQADSLLRILFLIREDFLARIEPFMRQLKPIQQARFRLALLDKDGAFAAITGPLRGTGKCFKEGVADALIEELLKERVETAQGEAVEVVGEYVEPVQLQVVCRNLWTSLPSDVQEISSEHLKIYGDVDQALQHFYESCLAEAKVSLDANELTLRQWFEQQLITPAGTRGIVFRDARRTADLPNPVVDLLENQHLIRGEWRAGSRWYELTHDRFIEPIQRANECWRVRRRARRNRWVMAGAVSLLVALVFFTGIYNAQQTYTQSSGVSTLAAATVVVEANARETAQAAAQSAEVAAQFAERDAALSKSRQLSAEALLVNDPDLALLLAVEANRQADTQEARRSLHRILSRQAIVDGKFLSDFNPVIVSPKVVYRLKGHQNWVQSVAFSPDGQKIVSGSKDTTLIIWDVATGNPVGMPLSGHESEVWSVAFSPVEDLSASAGLDGQIFLWNASNGQYIGDPLRGHTGWVTSVAFSPDGKRLVSGGSDGTIRVWDVSTGASLAVLQGHKDVVWCVAWSPDGSLLASGSADSMILLWDTKNFSEVRSLMGHRDLVRSLAWSPDGRNLASGGVIEEGKATWGEVIVWDILTGESKKLERRDEQAVRAVAFDPSGAVLAIGQANGAIMLWDVRRSKILGEPIRGHDQMVMGLAFSPDGRYMTSGSIDETVILWDFFTYTRSIAFSPDRNYMVSGSEDNAVRVWEVATENEISRMVHDAIVTSVAFSQDGIYVVSGSEDNTVRVWDAYGGKEIARMVHDAGVTSVAFSPDGKYVVSGSKDNTARVWDAYSGKEIARMVHDAVVTSVAFSPDGVYVLSGSEDKTARVWEAATGKEIARMVHGGSVSSVAFSRDGKDALSGSLDQTARLWDAITGKESVRMTLDTGVTKVAFSLDGEYMLTGNGRVTVRLWETATGVEITALSIPGTEIAGLVFSPDGKTLSIGTGSGSVLFWDLNLLDKGTKLEPYVEISCSQVKRSYTTSEWKLYFSNEDYRVTCSCQPGPKEVTIFINFNYQAPCQKLPIGSYSDLGMSGVPNDSTSSIQLGSNVQAYLCTDSGYSGVCELLTANVPNLGDQVIGNETLSSIRVEEKP